ncbi:MAG: hypothetical protein AB1668_06945 [Nanoarchaeota archaeon]
MEVGIAFSDANGFTENLPDLIKNYCRPEYVQKLCRSGQYSPDFVRELDYSWPGLRAIELQPEALYRIHGDPNIYSWRWVNLPELPGFDEFFKRCKVVGLHGPTTDGKSKYPKRRDLSSLDESHRHWSELETKEAMSFAHNDLIQAGYFVIHPGQFDDPEQHEAKKRQFLKSLDHLFAHYTRNGHRYTICLENLERPKFPSSEGEMLEIYEQALAIARKYDLPEDKIRLIFDIPHFCHNVLIDRGFNQKSLDDVIGEVAGVIERNHGLIYCYHLAGCRKKLDANGKPYFATHEDIPLIERFYSAEQWELNLQWILDILNKFPAPIILEVFNLPAKDSRSSVKNVSAYLDKKR